MDHLWYKLCTLWTIQTSFEPNLIQTKGKKIKKLSLWQRCVEKQENIDVLPQLSCRERTTVRALLNVQRPVKIICDIPTCRQVNCKASLTTRGFWSNVKARKEEFNSYKYCSFVIVSEHFNNDCNYQSLSLSPVTLLQPECQHGSTRSAYVLTFQYSQGTALQKKLRIVSTWKRGTTTIRTSIYGSKFLV